jgi:hypothetical protein
MLAVVRAWPARIVSAGVIIVFPLMLLIVAYVILLAPGGSSEGLGCRWFWAWAAAGVLFMFSVVSGFSIGLFIAPFALVFLLALARHSPHRAERAGLALGAGFVLLFIAYANRSGEHEDPLPWLVSGAALSAAGIAAYTLYGHARRASA